MTKYIDKSALVAEIERRTKEHHSGYLVCLKDILSFIDTLKVKEVREEPAHCTGIGEPKEESGVLGEMIKEIKEEPKDHCEDPVSEELEKAAVNAFKQIVDSDKNNFLEIFKAGAEWQKKQMVAKAIDGVVTFDYYDSNKTYGCVAHDSFCLEDFGLKDRDKVKVIVIMD